MMEPDQQQDAVNNNNNDAHVVVEMESKKQSPTPEQQTNSGGEPIKKKKKRNEGRSDKREERRKRREEIKKLKEQKKKKEKPDLKKSLKMFVHMAKIVGPEWILVLLGSLTSIASGIIPLMFYLIFGDILNVFYDPTATKSQLRDSIAEIAFKMLGVAAGSALASFLSQAFLAPANERIAMRLRDALFRSITKQDIAFFDKNQTGEVLNLLSEEVQQVKNVWGEKIGQVFQFTAQFIAGIIMAFTYSWKMTLVLLACGPIMFFSIMITGIAVKIFQTKQSAVAGAAVSTAEEVIGSFRTVRAFAGEKKEIARFGRSLTTLSRIGLARGITQGFTLGILFATIWSANAGAFWFGGWLVIEDRKNGYQASDFQPGDMLRVFGLMLFAVIGLAQAMAILPEISKAAASINIIVETMLRKPSINYEGGKKLDRIEGAITIENVVFKYPTRDTIVLKGVTIDIKPGETVALVGSSGSGKSTIVSLVERFYDPLEGRVLIDGVDIRELDPQWLHQQIGIVTQEPTLFATTIEENIKYGRIDATHEQVVEAAKKANCHDFISALPDGYKTKVGERGVSMSGGQKQRIAIARAILKDPRILLLDEATSALDTESERLVQEALDVAMKGRTTIAIAHRLSTIQNSDRIIVMRYGTIAEEGKHDDLIRKEGGEYQKLAKKQMMVPAATNTSSNSTNGNNPSTPNDNNNNSDSSNESLVDENAENDSNNNNNNSEEQLQ